MQFNGLTALFLGDSITQGVGASDYAHSYVQVVAKLTGMNVKNYGVGGTRIARQTQPSACPEWDDDFITRALRMEKQADLVCVFGGTNDYGHGFAPIGNIDDCTPDTFYGALNTLFSYLIRTYPKAYIFVLTPIHRINEQSPRGDGYKPATFGLKGYADIIREVAEKYALPVLDLFATSGIYPDLQESREAYTSDGLHPNDAGHEKIAKMIVRFLENNYVG